MFSCTNQIDYESDNLPLHMQTIENERIHPLIDNQYVAYVDDQYVITISKEEALEIGITCEQYEQLDSALREGNKLLKSVIEECQQSSKKVTTRTLQYDDVMINTRTLKTRTESGATGLPSGVLETMGQEAASTGLDLPIEMRSVVCNCYARAALLPMHVVTTSSFGDTQIGSKLGYSVNIQVNFSANNTVGGITYRTTDSNGGICAWQGSSGRATK